MQSDTHSYTAIDAEIREWMKAHSPVLFDTFAGQERRFCYLSSRQGECLQISIEPPDHGMVRIHLWDVESADDEEVHLEWKIAASEVQEGLDIALRSACAWFERRGP